MSWPNRVNLSDERTAYIDLTQCDNTPSELWIPAGHYGSSKRFRFRPDTLAAEWQWGVRDDSWKLRRVTVSGNRIHKTAPWGVNLNYVGYSNSPGEIPDWAQSLVDEARPQNIERF